MISVKAERAGDGWDATIEINGHGDCLFHELRSLMCEFLSDNELAEMFTYALSIELEGAEKHD